MATSDSKERKTVSARLDPEFHKEVRVEAAKRDLTMADFIRNLLKDEIREEEE